MIVSDSNTRSTETEGAEPVLQLSHELLTDTLQVATVTMPVLWALCTFDLPGFTIVFTTGTFVIPDVTGTFVAALLFLYLLTGVVVAAIATRSASLGSSVTHSSGDEVSRGVQCSPGSPIPPTHLCT